MKSDRFAAHVLVLGVTVGLAIACNPDGWSEPSADSSGVTVPYPPVFRELADESGPDPVFGLGSTDLSFRVIGQLEGSSDRTLNLAYPRRSELRGYGRFAGSAEVYRRTPMVDDFGVHAVRTAVYRTDSAGLATNVWYSYLAKDLEGGLYFTQFSAWDWQSGNADVDSVPVGAIFLFPQLAGTHQFRDAWFGLHPGLYDLNNLTRTVILSTDAVAPTTGLGACTLYLFNHQLPSMRYLAYLHESLGLVEIVYSWNESSQDGEEERLMVSILPVDGFALVSGSVDTPAPQGKVTNPLSGVWRGSATNESGDSLAFELELSELGAHFDPARGSHDVDGVYRDERTGTVHLAGRYDPTDGNVTFLSGKSFHSVSIRAHWDGGGHLDTEWFSRVADLSAPDSDEAEFMYDNFDGQAAIVRVSP